VVCRGESTPMLATTAVGPYAPLKRSTRALAAIGRVDWHHQRGQERIP
jgi:hypothetical protein